MDSENAANDLKINFHLELALTCSESWVRHPSHLDLMYTSRNFTVFVDPTGLEPGVHSAYVQAIDVKKPDKGALFEIPVTVVIKEPLDVSVPKPVVTYKHVSINH